MNSVYIHADFFQIKLYENPRVKACFETLIGESIVRIKRAREF